MVKRGNGMRIAFDAQFLYDSMKTGIGKSAEYILKNLNLREENEYFLNVKDVRRHNLYSESMNELLKRGYQKALCPWYLNSIASRLPEEIMLPYSKLFPKEVDATIFFNFLVPRGVRGKVLTVIHDMTYKTFPETVEETTRKNLDRNMDYIINRADSILVVSEFSRQELIRYYPHAREKTKVILWGVDRKQFHPNYTQQEKLKVLKKHQIDMPYILYLGTLEPRKNISRLIKAYAKLYKEKKVLHKLVVAGKKGWMYNDIYEIIRQNQLEDNVVFTGYVEDSDMPVLMAAAELFTFPSLYEGFGLPPLEAMACGTPVLVSNTASLPEVVGDAGILVNPYDIDDIANAIEAIVNDDDKKMMLKAAGLERAKRYSWENAAKQMERYLMELQK